MRPAAESDLRSESGNRQPQPGENVGEMRQSLRCRSGIGALCRLVADEAHVRLAFGQAVEAEPEEIAQRVHERDRLSPAGPRGGVGARIEQGRAPTGSNTSGERVCKS